MGIPRIVSKKFAFLLWTSFRPQYKAMTCILDLHSGLQNAICSDIY